MNQIHNKIDTIMRYVLAHTLSGILPLYIINEHPKSGGTWVGQLLMRALDVPFPRNQLPCIKPSILHGHYTWQGGMKNVTVVWRDGRDVMVSWYYHCMNKNEIANSRLVDIVRRKLNFNDVEDIRTNLPSFIQYAFSGQRYPRFSWKDFVQYWYGRPGVVYIRYEDLRQNTAEELTRVVRDLTGRKLSPQKAQSIAKEFSFSNQSGRPAGHEQKGRWLRKGIAGDWKNHFSPEACEVFNRYAGDELLLLGYERDRSWMCRDSVIDNEK